MAIRDDFEVAAGQVRAAVQRFALGLLVIAAFGAMLVGKADTVLVEHARVLALDLASPVLEAIARPVAVANRTIADLKEFASLREENARVTAGDDEAVDPVPGGSGLAASEAKPDEGDEASPALQIV